MNAMNEVQTQTPIPTLQQKLGAEFAGTALLLIIVVGSGIMAERLAGADSAVALLANAIATGCGLYGLILALGPISGAQLNPVVSLLMFLRDGLSATALVTYVLAQISGAVTGVWIAHAMFNQPILQVSHHLRSTGGERIGEVVATTGLLLLISIVGRQKPQALPGAIAAYITGAYWFTSSTSFANPAVTLARSLTSTYAGIDPSSVPAFILAQVSSVALCIGVLLMLPRHSH